MRSEGLALSDWLVLAHWSEKTRNHEDRTSGGEYLSVGPHVPVGTKSPGEISTLELHEAALLGPGMLVPQLL